MGESRATLKLHYVIPCEGLPELATVGIAHIAIFAFRCGKCECDFHIDAKPAFCPNCGVKFEKEMSFAEWEAGDV